MDTLYIKSKDNTDEYQISLYDLEVIIRACYYKDYNKVNKYSFFQSIEPLMICLKEIIINKQIMKYINDDDNYIVVISLDNDTLANIIYKIKKSDITFRNNFKTDMFQLDPFYENIFNRHYNPFNYDTFMYY